MSHQSELEKYSSSKKRTYYDVLLLPRNATKTEIKEAYVKLAKLYHPDQNPDDSKAAIKFQEAQEAYHTLGSPWKRQLYDRELDENFSTKSNFGSHVKHGFYQYTEETHDQKRERKERYRRYAAGLREDVPDEQQYGFFLTLVCCFAIIGAFSYLYPSRCIREENRYRYDDDAQDLQFKGDTLVQAFYNPLSGKWERVLEGYAPPPPHVVYKEYESKYENINLNKKSLPTQEFTAIKIPRSQTELAEIVVDPKTGEVFWTADLKKRSLDF